MNTDIRIILHTSRTTAATNQQQQPRRRPNQPKTNNFPFPLQNLLLICIHFCLVSDFAHEFCWLLINKVFGDQSRGKWKNGWALSRSSHSAFLYILFTCHLHIYTARGEQWENVNFNIAGRTLGTKPLLLLPLKPVHALELRMRSNKSGSNCGKVLSDSTATFVVSLEEPFREGVSIWNKSHLDIYFFVNVMLL